METMNTGKKIIFAALVVAVLGGVFYLNSEKAPRDSTLKAVDVEPRIGKTEKEKRYETAKEITTPDGFINTTNGESVTIGEFVGKKVVLVDFWTYSCINCQRTTPYLNAWYGKYKDKGLVIIGIHTPEFEFEKMYNNVVNATKRLEIKYPVVLDNDYSTWNAYKNRFWPRKYLIDIDGYIVYDHIGEGAYEETEAKILELLNERGETLGKAAISVIDAPVSADDVDFSRVRTPEIYLGYGRSKYLANLPSEKCFDNPCDYVKQKEVAMNTYTLSGMWNMGEEAISLVAKTGEIIIRFSANKVNLVGGSSEDIQAEILLDGIRVNSAFAGNNVSPDGTVTFKEYDLYNLIDLNGEYGEHELIIRFIEPGIDAFAFTFG